VQIDWETMNALSVKARKIAIDEDASPSDIRLLALSFMAYADAASYYPIKEIKRIWAVINMIDVKEDIT